MTSAAVAKGGPVEESEGGHGSRDEDLITGILHSDFEGVNPDVEGAFKSPLVSSHKWSKGHES